jgi:N-succinyldiaminopimelate aminotransferase
MTKLANERGAINLSQGFPDFDAPEEIIEAAVHALHSGLNQYARSRGHIPLAEAVSQKIKRTYDLEYDVENEILVTCGVTEGIASTFLGLLNPGDEIIFFEPHYDSYPVCAALAGASCRFYTLRFPDFTIHGDELDRCFTEKTRILFINTPHNPTGKVFSREELEMISELCKKHDVIAVTDEVYEHLTYDDASHIPIASLPGMRERTLTISGAGKTFSITGWRIGWITGPADLISAIQTAHQYITFAPATPLQDALASIIRNIPDVYFINLRNEYTKRRSILLEALRKTGFAPAVPAGTYYILADFTRIRQEDDVEFVHYLIDRCGVAAIPPSGFYSKDTKEGKRLVRFAFCKREETLLKAAKAISRI